MTVTLRAARASDAGAIHNLVMANLEAGHLLPRAAEDIRGHLSGFVVADADGEVVGCAELARLGPLVAEVRSLVVQEGLRGQRIGSRIVEHLAHRAAAAGHGTLCAFTHNPSLFVRLGFTIVPHTWMPEKIAHDCTSCALFRHCGQYAVRLSLREGTGVLPVHAAVTSHGRGVARRRPNVERLQLAQAAARGAAAEAARRAARAAEPAEPVLA